MTIDSFKKEYIEGIKDNKIGLYVDVDGVLSDLANSDEINEKAVLNLVELFKVLSGKAKTEVVITSKRRADNKLYKKVLNALNAVDINVVGKTPYLQHNLDNKVPEILIDTICREYNKILVLDDFNNCGIDFIHDEETNKFKNSDNLKKDICEVSHEHLTKSEIEKSLEVLIKEPEVKMIDYLDEIKKFNLEADLINYIFDVYENENVTYDYNGNNLLNIFTKTEIYQIFEEKSIEMEKNIEKIINYSNDNNIKDNEIDIFYSVSTSLYKVAKNKEVDIENDLKFTETA